MFQKQTMMRRVLLSLIPIYLLAIYLYGWRFLLLGALVFGVGIGIEYLFERRRGKKVSEAILVTCSLFLLSLPSSTPWWIAIIGISFAVVVGKEVFGGFGRNIFNPAITGRLFIYITFPSQLQSGYFTPGNFGIGADVLSSATPLELLRQGGSVDLLMSFLGIRPGAMGETSLPLIILAAIFLIATRTASWRIILMTLAGAAAVTTALDLAGVTAAIPSLGAFVSGSIVFTAVFIATDPVSAPKKPAAQWLYGLLIGTTAVVIRTFSLFPEGTSFGILLGNTFASLLDEMFGKKKKTTGLKSGTEGSE